MLYADPFLTVYCCLLAALLGACMGSFLNCAAWRIVHGESVLRGRSHCDACGVGSRWSASWLPTGAAAIVGPSSPGVTFWPRPSRRWCS